MNYKKINNLVGWAVFFISAVVYIMTMEPHGSLWDCGEFAGSANHLGVPHPPGAPLFILIGRLFIILGNVVGVGAGASVALMSALCSAFTILFLFWTITHFAKKIKETNNIEITKSDIFDIMAAGFVGALAYTFSDSFWYSAVESEVYAMSSMCTAVVFWAALKWEDHPENNLSSSVDGRNRADKWMILIFFTIGMSIGVHLLNILTIPPIILLYYFKRYKKSNKGIIKALFASILILGFVQKAVGQWSVGTAFPFERFFVNKLGLPVLSGFLFFFALVAVGFYFAIRYTNKNNNGLLRLGLWCLVFTLIGMSTYMTTMIRSNANPGIDMYNVDNPYALKGYLSREQYGDFPLLYGQTYEGEVLRDQDRNVVTTPGDDKYVLRKDDDGRLKYIVAGKNVDYDYINNDKMLFPRIWYGNEENRKSFYKQWLNPKFEIMNMADFTVEDDLYDTEQEANNAAVQKNKLAKQEQYKVRDHLTQKQNISWLLSYQINWMYLRYFMWNFVGKQNDIQGFSSKRDGNWISGISFLDNMRLGDQSNMPDALKKNKSNNKLYFLPLILGLIGCFYQYKKQRDDWLVTLLLFLMTGLAIVIYLNQYGLQPRERDYAFVGSFYAFAFWIGLGVLQVRDWFSKFTNGITPGIIAATICTLAVPVLMANQEWDDHDRSHKLLARDLAKDYLNSCPQNAILFTIGDNDTYPLWYAQEVEGIRKDIRVVNTSLLGIDWYLDQLKYKVNESAPFRLIWNSNDYEGQNLDQAYFYGLKRDGAKQQVNENYSLDSFLLKTKSLSSLGDAWYPSKKYYVNIDLNKSKQLYNLQPGDSLTSRLDATISESTQALNKGDFGILNIVAGNINERPICFTDDNGANLGGLGLQPFLRREGMIYRIIPSYKFNKTETEKSKTTMLSDSFGYGNAKHLNVYFDEENRRHLESIRSSYISIAGAMVNENKFDDAKSILHRVDDQLPNYSLPYGSPSRQESINNTSLEMAQVSFLAKDNELGNKIFKEVSNDIDQQLKYYYTLSNPNGKPTKENVAQFVKDFQDLYNITNRRQVTQEEGMRYEGLQKSIFKNDLTGFTVQDAYANMRNYNTMLRIKDTYVEPKPVADVQQNTTPKTNLVPTAQKVKITSDTGKH